MKAQIINIGDEILIGDTVNTNASWMASKLDQSGVEVNMVVVIADDSKAIVKSLEEAIKVADIILMTGGLGPTHDDITKHTLNQFFKDKLVINEEVLLDVTEMVTRNGKEINALNKSQAMVPSSCEVIRNQKGTAPGMIFEKNGKTIVSMPGVPYEMKHMMQEVVLPRLTYLNRRHVRLHRHILTFGIAESALAELLKPALDKMSDQVKLAFLPSPGHVKLRLSAKGKDLKSLKSLIESEEGSFLKHIQDYTYGVDNETIERAIGELLTKSGKTLSTAESCTGGTISSKVTSIPGSSAYFKGTVVSYTNEAKSKILKVSESVLDEFGAVSENVVVEMAKGARNLFGSDYSIATSGIAGPDGGTDEKPVGTIWIALSSDAGIHTKKLNLRFNRTTNINLTSDYALNMLRKELKKGLIDR